MVSEDAGHGGEDLFWDADAAIRRWDAGATIHRVEPVQAQAQAPAPAPVPVSALATAAIPGPARNLDPAPARARMLVLSPDDSAIAAILRTRPGREPYAVLPGGGLEPEDADPLSGALRELTEETGLTGDDVDLLTSSVVVEGEQWIFLARARRGPALRLGGPETARDTEVHGTYEPVWLRPRIALETLGGRVHPDWITRMIAGAR